LVKSFHLFLVTSDLSWFTQAYSSDVFEGTRQNLVHVEVLSLADESRSAHSDCHLARECGGNLKRVRLFKTFRGLIVPGVREELIQDQGIARSFFIGRPDAGI
jgi:hypothetical protein